MPYHTWVCTFEGRLGHTLRGSCPPPSLLIVGGAKGSGNDLSRLRPASAPPSPGDRRQRRSAQHEPRRAGVEKGLPLLGDETRNMKTKATHTRAHTRPCRKNERASASFRVWFGCLGPRNGRWYPVQVYAAVAVASPRGSLLRTSHFRRFSVRLFWQQAAATQGSAIDGLRVLNFRANPPRK